METSEQEKTPQSEATDDPTTKTKNNATADPSIITSSTIPVVTLGSSRSSKKRARQDPSTTLHGRGMNNSSSAAAAAATPSSAVNATASTSSAVAGMSNLHAILYSSGAAGGNNTITAASIPTVEQMTIAATKATNENPPFVHISSKDASPQLKVEDGLVKRRLVLKGPMKGGYRMARASHGISAPSPPNASEGKAIANNYYYEVLILPPPSAKEITENLPANARLGKGLQKEIQDQIRWEQLKHELEKQQKLEEEDANFVKPTKRGKNTQKNNSPIPFDDETEPGKIMMGGHVRIGWSMRTGDLNAPVGYDRWSYGVRDIMGSRIHASRREDHWGGLPFGPGDVVGFAISLIPPSSGVTGDASSQGQADNNSNQASAQSKRKGQSKTQPSTNHIRFFKNGEPLGDLESNNGIRSGGAAFDNIQSGTYYPAISAYMGGTVKINFGPYFIYPPRPSKLPSGMKMKPVSELCPPPPPPDEAVSKAIKERAFPKKTDEGIVLAFRDAVRTEARILYDAYKNHMQRHVEEVREHREKRRVSTNDLPIPSESNEDVNSASGGNVEEKKMRRASSSPVPNNSSAKGSKSANNAVSSS